MRCLLYAVLLLMISLPVGCVAPIDGGSHSDSGETTGGELPTAAVAESLAKFVDAGVFRHSDEMLQTVKLLAASKQIGDATADRLIDACPGIRQTRRPLTGTDATALRAVK